MKTKLGLEPAESGFFSGFSEEQQIQIASNMKG
jgi:hypothetical protein